MAQIRTPPPSEGRASPPVSDLLQRATYIGKEQYRDDGILQDRMDGITVSAELSHTTQKDDLPRISEIPPQYVSVGPVLDPSKIRHITGTTEARLSDSDLKGRQRNRPGYQPLRSASALSPNVSGSTNRPRDIPSFIGGHDHDTHKAPRKLTIETGRTAVTPSIISPQPRPATARALSTPANIKSPESVLSQRPGKLRASSRSDLSRPKLINSSSQSPMPASTTTLLPPLSLPTYLQLELSSYRPSQLFGSRTTAAEPPYEPSHVKIERLLNFIFLPFHLEGVLWFGTLACLDSWLYIFTILPLRLLKSLYILLRSWLTNLISEIQYILSFILNGLRRMWQRRGTVNDTTGAEDLTSNNNNPHQSDVTPVKPRARSSRHYPRMKSTTSSLLPEHKADLLKSLLIIFTCLSLLQLDASRMYHWVRGQAAIKLYVIYNVLEVCDRLLAAIGQDVLECLFSRETLEGNADGHSKVLRPFWLFVLALAYTIVHSTALFYQVVTLNVAVNSYSNALITLLMSNQFVEIKSTVFKKFEKDSLFQLTCADVVERFQLWQMLMIIVARNVVETGGLNFGVTTSFSSSTTTIPSSHVTNGNVTSMIADLPQTVSLIISQSLASLPTIWSALSTSIPTLTPIVTPFVIVLGSEMLIDWLKHAYVNKFNNVRPAIYGRFLDVLAKDYYTNAFGDQDLTKRLGLPVIPLSCLMIRASLQTYQMFVAALVRTPSPSATSLASIQELYSVSKNSTPTSSAALVAQKLDTMLYQIPSSIAKTELTSYFTTILIVLLIFLVLLACKLMLGMSLLMFARSRYQRTSTRERASSHHVEGSKRVGGWGVVEVDDEKRRRIYDDDPNGLRVIKEREARDTAKRELEKSKGFNMEGLDKVRRYEMVAKRIW